MPGVDIKKDDNVRVISGKDRGKEGRVVRVMPLEGRVMVDGVALAKKHSRTGAQRTRTGQQLQQGGIIDTELFIDISNVQIVCDSCKEPTRVGYEIDGDDKTRICRKCGSPLQEPVRG
jgi:large subunit ribosomal protein L24